MSKARVYELAKQLSMENKELLKVIADLGIEVKNPLSAFARIAPHSGMAVLRAGLTRQHRQLFRTTALSVNINQHRQAGLLKLPEAEVRYLNLPLLSLSQDNTRLVVKISTDNLL